MAAKGFERRAGVLFAAVALAATTAAFAIGRAEAQTVNPVPPPPPPVFNPSGPSTVPQTPEVPVAPTPPSGLSGSAPAPASPAVEPPPAVTPQAAPAPAPVSPAVEPVPAVTPQTAPAPAPPSPAVASPPASPAIAPPAPVTPQATTVPEAAKPALSRMHVRHHGSVRHRWRSRYARYHAVRVVGPSYYPGSGEFYPPYAHPCHFSQVWSGYYAPYWAYSCSW